MPQSAGGLRVIGMSSGVLYVMATAGMGFAIAVIVIGARALKQSKTVDVFERQPQPYMIQAEPPSPKVQAIGLPQRESDVDRVREKQA
jgi:hypothetical protein